MSEPTQTLISMAKGRPDPKIISDWLAAYLGKRPADAKRKILSAVAAELGALPANGPDARATGLVLRVAQKLLGTIG